MNLSSIVYVGLGGALGSILRYLLALFIANPFPFATLFVNAVGSALLGFLTHLFTQPQMQSSPLKLLLCVGFCGGFTTFSTFSVQTMQLIQSGKINWAFYNILSNLLICILFAFAGFFMSRLLVEVQ